MRDERRTQRRWWMALKAFGWSDVDPCNPFQDGLFSKCAEGPYKSYCSIPAFEECSHRVALNLPFSTQALRRTYIEP